MGRPHARRSTGRDLLRLLWQQPLVAIPFALFFGALFVWESRGMVIVYEMALIFAYAIALCLWALRHFILPRFSPRPAEPGRQQLAREALLYGAASLVGAYAAAAVIHFTIMPGFLGSARAVLISGMFTLLFCALFTGIAYAIVFYRQAVERARAVETVRAELAQAELRALRAQINPHFLFNTLNSIAALITENPAAAEETTTRLADVFRYALTATYHDSARFGDELEFLRSYLEIERTRLGQRLRVRVEVEPGLESARVPSLLLQPLVENAVRHAVSPRPEGGTVRLGARRVGDRLVVEIADDGPGMNPSGSAAGNGFGLHSVRERLRAAGPPHALEIESAPGAGTVVRVTLPLTFPTASADPIHQGDHP